MSKPDEQNDANAKRPGRSLLADWSRRYRTPLLRFFGRRTAGVSEQEDLVQEVFVRLARRSDLHEIDDIDRYIFRSASNVLIDWRRQRSAHAAASHDTLSDDLESPGFDPERLLLGSDALARLISAVSNLPQRTQVIFSLYHFDHKTHAEIGRALGIAVRTVEDHMARANAHLLSAMERGA
jgi:RNA polymerase sigma factor (sigma-70 family)